MNQNYPVGEILRQIRAAKPLIHCITNYVTVNDCANALLAAGADPTLKDMWGHDALHHAEESITREDIVDGSEGMDEEVWRESMRLIEEAARKRGGAKKPAAKKKR